MLAGLLLLAAGCASIAHPDGWAPPEVLDDTLYITLDTGEMTAINPETYTEYWTFPEDKEFACGAGNAQERELDGIYGAPSVDTDRLFVGAWDGAVYAVDKESGVCLWRFETGDPIVGGTVLGDAGLYVPSTDGNLYLLDTETGEEISRFGAGDIWSKPLLTEDALYVTTMEGRLWSFAPDTLERNWDAPFEVSTGLLTDPVVAGDVVIVGGIGNVLYGIDAATGDEMWSQEASNWFWGRPLVDGTTVYVTNLGGSVMAIDAASGDLLWEAETDSPVRAGAVMAAGVLVVVDRGGHVYRLDPETGDLVSAASELEKTVFATPTVLEGGLVLIAATNGDVFEYDADQGRTSKVID